MGTMASHPTAAADRDPDGEAAAPAAAPDTSLPPGLRDGVSSDRAALVDLWVLSWRAVFPAIDFEARRPWLDGHLDGLAAAGARLIVAEAAGALAGFVTVDAGRQHLDQLAVHPDHQGSGVADRLVGSAKALSPGGLALHVNADNGRARRFYARHGFWFVSADLNPRSGLPILLLRWRAADGDSTAHEKF